jgi:DNA-directed RNA polymerase I subunit RPA49
LAEILNAMILVSWPALEPSKSTPFKCYLRKKQEGGKEQKKEGEEEFAKQDTLVAGETESVEFFSSSETKVASVGSR